MAQPGRDEQWREDHGYADLPHSRLLLRIASAC
jgi:hypothetical protein